MNMAASPHIIKTKIYDKHFTANVTWGKCCGCSLFVYPKEVETAHHVRKRVDTWIGKHSHKIEIVNVETKDFDYDNFCLVGGHIIIHYYKTSV